MQNTYVGTFFAVQHTPGNITHDGIPPCFFVVVVVFVLFVCFVCVCVRARARVFLKYIFTSNEDQLGAFSMADSYTPVVQQCRGYVAYVVMFSPVRVQPATPLSVHRRSVTAVLVYAFNNKKKNAC